MVYIKYMLILLIQFLNICPYLIIKLSYLYITNFNLFKPEM